jgi:hypothetical protein
LLGSSVLVHTVSSQALVLQVTCGQEPHSIRCPQLLVTVSHRMLQVSSFGAGVQQLLGVVLVPQT